MKNRYHIPTPLYKKILAVMPVLTVDIVIAHEGKFLLLKRAIAPAKGQWWTPGGRVLKGEKLEEAARRKAKEETNISVDIVKFLGIYEIPEKRWGIPVHAVTVVYMARPRRKSSVIKMNFNNNDAKWFKAIPRNANPFVEKFLLVAGFH